MGPPSFVVRRWRFPPLDQVLAMTKRAKVTKMGFVGNEAYKRF